MKWWISNIGEFGSIYIPYKKYIYVYIDVK